LRYLPRNLQSFIDKILSNTNSDVRHHVSQNNFYDFAPQLISRADTHFASPRCVFQGSANFGLLRNSVFRQGIQLAARYQKGSGNID